MKPIAKVYWIVDGSEESMSLYEQSEIDRMSARLKRLGRVHWFCLLKGGMPPRARRRFVEAFGSSV